MSSQQAVAFLSFGLIITGSGPTTAPSPYDVRYGVDNGDGDLGTLTSPAQGDVRQGVQYGGNGDQYTGTLLIPGTGTGSAIARAWATAYRAQTAQVGLAYTATVGMNTAQRAIVSEMTEDEILAAGGTAESGGYHIQMLGTDLNNPPAKFDEVSTNVTTDPTQLYVLSANLNNGVWYVQIGDFVANES